MDLCGFYHSNLTAAEVKRSGMYFEMNIFDTFYLSITSLGFILLSLIQTLSFVWSYPYLNLDHECQLYNPINFMESRKQCRASQGEKLRQYIPNSRLQGIYPKFPALSKHHPCSPKSHQSSAIHKVLPTNNIRLLRSLPANPRSSPAAKLLYQPLVITALLRPTRSLSQISHDCVHFALDTWHVTSEKHRCNLFKLHLRSELTLPGLIYA